MAIDPHSQSTTAEEDAFALWCPEAPGLPAGREREEAWARVATYADAAGLDRAPVAASARHSAQAERETAGDPWRGRLTALADALATGPRRRR